jgi:hypothetical protein
MRFAQSRIILAVRLRKLAWVKVAKALGNLNSIQQQSYILSSNSRGARLDTEADRVLPGCVQLSRKVLLYARAMMTFVRPVQAVSVENEM